MHPRRPRGSKGPHSVAPRFETIDLDGTSSAYFAPATITNAQETIHISGQVGVSRQGHLPADYESQIHLALLNLHRVLIASKTTISDILKLTLYIVDYDPERRKHTPIIQKFLRKHRPAITLVPVTQLAVPGWLFEVDAVVARHPQQPQIARSLSAVPKVDVVVIGAGLAGLTTASHVTKAGYSCVILEARNRVGGRTWSQKMPSGDTMYDIGAAWINDTNQSRMTQLARQFGAELIEQNTDGSIVLEDTDKSLKHFPYGELPTYPDDIKAHLAYIRDTFEDTCQSLSVTSTTDAKSTELDSITFLAYLNKLGANDKAIEIATIWTRAMVGHDPADISALFFLHYCKAGGGLMQMRSDRKGGGQHLRVRQGTQMFSINLANTLPHGTIHFNAPVVSIAQVGAQDVIVSSDSDGPTFQARKVVSAIPHPVLKTIEFTPPLPLAKKLLIDSYKYGYYQKVLVVFKTPFWIDRGSCGLIQSFIGPATVIRDTSIPVDGKHVLTCFVGGGIGEAWWKLPSTEQKQEAILKQIGDAFQDHEVVKSEYVEMLGHEWIEEQWNGYGCPSPVFAPGVLSAVGHALKERVGDVHFAGTETSDVWRGYMEGAVRSGDREAKLVLDDLKGTTAKI